MNPVLILTHNCLDLTKRCVESVHRQEVSTQLNFVDNGSTDGTKDWIRTQVGDAWWDWPTNQGVSAGWNDGLRLLFRQPEVRHVLVLNNDTYLPSWFYSELLSYDVPFVTGVAVDQMPTERSQRMPLVPHPDFSAFLIRRECWEKIGPFDERMKIYVSDCDYHVRAHRKGVPLWKANVPYFHINSQTLKRASAEDRAQIESQANKDREVFRSIYGCMPGTKEYQELFNAQS